MTAEDRRLLRDIAHDVRATVIDLEGRTVLPRSCSICFDQPTPWPECPACKGSGDPCHPGLRLSPARRVWIGSGGQP